MPDPECGRTARCHWRISIDGGSPFMLRRCSTPAAPFHEKENAERTGTSVEVRACFCNCIAYSLAKYHFRETAARISDAGLGGESLAASSASAQFHPRNSSITDDTENQENVEHPISAKSVTISSADPIRVSRRRFRRSANKIRESAGMSDLILPATSHCNASF